MSRHASIALVSTSCRFPDANSAAELWANVLEGRRSFRALPKERLDIARYAAEAIGESDSITRIRAGLLADWQFDRAAFRIPQKTAAATDLTHWLALELAAEAIAAIGGPDRLDRTRTAVVVANTMAGEFSRAALMRLRLPFLQDLVAEASTKAGLADDAAERLRGSFAAALRSSFPDPNEDTLAGGLANTIAGRIANYFDLRGGAYSVDGACASSLVALADAANLLVSEQADAVVVAAVDLSLDPFELVGFSRNGALAGNEMRVFDARAEGFWPGEGGACTLLMREPDARARGLPVMARIRGWGISTDGAGGLTRPSSDGQLAAYRRAYEMADVSPTDIAFVEAHGTGTAVGDPIEVRALAALRDSAPASLPIGSIKANIGHTKAAAGLAGLVKSVEALRHGVVPPHVSCDRPHPVFEEVDGRVRTARACERIENCAVAGVSSFGFGGINAHVVIERADPAPARAILPRAPVAQDAELFVFAADDVDQASASIAAIEIRAGWLSMSEFSDAAAHAAAPRSGAIRIAVVAAHAGELGERLARAKAAIIACTSVSDADGGVFVDRPARRPRVGFLFPGQGAPSRPDGGAWRRRFADATSLLDRVPWTAGRNSADTDIAQPSIIAASFAALRVLEQLNVSASIAAGHSLGEIAALAWAGALTQEAAFDLAVKRGAIMARTGSPGGAMLRVALSACDADVLARETGTVVACRNGPLETVLAGTRDAIALAAARCRSRGVDATRLSVSHAFHSPAMQAGAGALADALETVPFETIRAAVVSTIKGTLLTPHQDMRPLLVEQLTAPVAFAAALEQVVGRSDILVEVGSGYGLTRLAQPSGIPVFSVDAFGDSVKPLLCTAGALFTAGADLRIAALFEGRNVRAFEPWAVPRFIASPCGARPGAGTPGPVTVAPVAQEHPFYEIPDGGDALAVTLAAVAREVGSDVSAVGACDRFLDVLHLNSLAVIRIVTAAAKALGIRVPSAPTEFANATPRQLAAALAELQTFGDADDAPHRIAGVRRWVRTYAMTWSQGRERRASAIVLRWHTLTPGEQLPLAEKNDGAFGLVLSIDRLTAALAERLVAAAADAARAGIPHLAFCHRAQPIAAFARSIAREGYFQSVRLIDHAGAEIDDPRVAAALSADVAGYYEVRLDREGGVEEPIFAPQAAASCASAALSADDVVVVVGGGRGIAAECTLRIARRGTTIILVGRSAPEDPDVATTLARAERSGANCRYVTADVLDRGALAAALAAPLAEFGPATALIYAPALNEPRRLTELDADIVRRTLAPKVPGLESMLSVLGPSLRRIVTFGSIIGVIGLEGEAHYALANAMQTVAAEVWAAAQPGRAALSIEWSIWGGIGMGERLGTIERLDAKGVDALSVDDALDAFDRLIDGNATGAIAVTSRFGPPPDLSLELISLPLLRFVDEPKVLFPGVEAVFETTLSRGRDCYLEDHAVDGDQIFPAVMALEAMAQVASVLQPVRAPLGISDVQFRRPAIVDRASGLRIRIAALRDANGKVDVAIFAEDDGFAVSCMRASIAQGAVGFDRGVASKEGKDGFPAAPLYGPLFFGSGRFRRIDRFIRATSREVEASISPAGDERWFGPFESDATILWPPGTTDAAIHALQVAVPHRRVLPVEVERIDVARRDGALACVIAVERAALAGTYVFDLIMSDAEGHVLQRWTGAKFQAIGEIAPAATLTAVPEVAAIYLERLARELIDDDTVRVALMQDEGKPREWRRTAALRLLNIEGHVDRREDGLPQRNDGRGCVSFAHRDGVTLAVSAMRPVGCDVEAGGRGDVDERSGLRIEDVVATETCRKLGFRTSCFEPGRLSAGNPVVRDGIRLLIVELPTSAGPRTVALGSLDPDMTTASPIDLPALERAAS